ncbi:MAG: GreA/GreB family elongation factor [Chthoniobacter sp.]|uniref:GreA/GreB family elongation factor n=1 Tax=Chthoniobacter sp. TaxID=2510640 RepID=UPI0032A32DAB
MSKAFTRENDDAVEETAFAKAALPSGTRNYMTADGAEHLRRELAALLEQRRQQEQDADGEAAQDELRRTNARLQALSQRLAEADVVTMSDGPADEVRFGMFVTIRADDGTEDEYRIVGVDEVDLEASGISWLSPLAQTLIGKKVGEVARFLAPVGEKSFRIVSIRLPQAAESN